MAVRADGMAIPNIGNRTPSQAAQTAAGYARSYMPATIPTSISSTPEPPVDNTPTNYGNMVPAAAPVYSDVQAAQDALNTPEYVLAQQRLSNALGLFNSQQSSDQQRYDLNYEQALRNLGWIPEQQTFDMGQLRTSQGLDTTSGKAFTDNLNDFAARGLSQSGMFSVAQNAIQNRLQQQKLATETGRTNYLADLQSKKSQFAMDQEAQRQQALDAAKQNLLNQYLGQSGLGG
jgi:hypothetical protein